MTTPTMQRYAMTAREKIIEDFYLGIIARILAAKQDEAEKLRQELKRIAEHVEASRRNCR